MAGYTKLFSSITDSTIWREPHTTRIVWITMLALADRNGTVSMPVPGLADRARVTLPECEAALATFLSPDPYSRTEMFEGRRIEKIQGGWVLLNHQHYRELREAEDRREQARVGMQKLRAKRADDVNATVNTLTNVMEVSQASASASTASKALSDKSLGFEEFWKAYPNKKGKVPALKHWQRKRLGEQLPTILEDINRRIKGDPDWQRGAIPHGATYVFQERWNDAVAPDEVATTQARSVAGSSPVITGVEAKRREAESLAEMRRQYPEMFEAGK